MRLSFKSRLYTGFTLAILLCAVSGATSYYILQKQQAQRLWLKQSRSVLDSTKSVQNLLADMETGRRGYRSTNQKRFLEPYLLAAHQLPLTMTTLRKLLADNAELQSREISLEQKIGTITAFWKSSNSDTEEHLRDYITRMTDEEKTKMDLIRTSINDLQKEETKLLTRRRDEYDRLVRYASFSSAIDSLISEGIIIILIFIIIRELASRRKVQEQLRSSVNKLKTQTETLQTSETKLTSTLDELGKINKQLEKFVYTVAHDVKSPLSGIIGMLSLIEADKKINEDAELMELVTLASTAGYHLSGMVNSLLEYSRVSIADQAVETVNTRELLEQLAVLLFPPKNIHINVTGEMPVFITRKLKIEQVFQNLISNAIKYNGKEKGTIEVGCEEKDTCYRFFVKDNGIGISDNDKSKAFTLVRPLNDRPVIDTSTGFGLNIVKLIVEEQGGNIWYDSVPGEGSTFYFEWKK